MIIRVLFFTLLLLVNFYSCSSFAEDLLQVPAAIHLSTTVSEGKYGIEQITQFARQNKIKAIMITDFCLNKLQYGIQPFRNVIQKTEIFNCVFKFGIGNYLDLIAQAKEKNPDMVFIPGVEVAPFYYWQGDFFHGNLTLKDWHKHLLVIGLKNVEDYKNLPVAGNSKALLLPFTSRDIINFWPLALVAAGFMFLWKRKFNYEDEGGKKLGPFSPAWRSFGAILIIAGLLFLWNNYPFSKLSFSPYDGCRSIAPYENLINYAKERGGLTFWAHPEAEYTGRQGPVKIVTAEHSADLVSLQDYTGFALFWEGYQKVGCPGCLWDKILNQYCQGKRRKPVWAIAGLSFDAEGDLEEYLKNLRTILLVPELNENTVLDALAQGRVYVLSGKGAPKFMLDEFSASDSGQGEAKTMGQTLNLSGRAVIKIKGHFLDGQQQTFRIQLIKNGLTLKVLEADSPFELVYEDDALKPGETSYYRLEIKSPGVLVITNPIFVKKQQS